MSDLSPTASQSKEAQGQPGYSPHITASFGLSGKQLPADHGYLLYSAISRAFPFLHGVDWLAIELISGFPSGPGLITLDSPINSKLGTRNSKLSLRIPADHYRDVLPLAGKRLDVGGHQIRLGLPVARPLEPAPSLYARVVTIKKFTEADSFLEAINRKLDSFGIKARVELPRADVRASGEGEQVRRRRVVTIHGKSVAVRRSLRFVQRLSAITEFRDFSLLTFHNHNPIAQRLLRPDQNTATSNVESTGKCMWDCEWDRE